MREREKEKGGEWMSRKERGGGRGRGYKWVWEAGGCYDAGAGEDAERQQHGRNKAKSGSRVKETDRQLQ